jgi:arylsulfatase A-like enzyme
VHPQPNILFVFSDQQHWQAAGFEDPFFVTPHLDRLAARATVFDHAFCTTPQCSPSRSSLLTGRYPTKTGVLGNVESAGGQPLRMRTIGAMLQEMGYETAYFGKWHLGKDPVGAAGWDFEHDVLGPEALDDPAVTGHALDFLASRTAGEKPFALFLSYNNPHDVYEIQRAPAPPGQPRGILSDAWRRETFAGKPAAHKQFMTEDQGRFIAQGTEAHWEAYHEFYREKVRLYDAEVGRVLGALRRHALEDSTLTVVTSDHGDMDTHHKLVFKGPFMYERLVRVPLILRVPEPFGAVAPGRVSDLVCLTDLVPTLLDFAGRPGFACDGFSLRPFVTGTGAAPKRDFVIGQYYGKQKWVNPIRMIRTRKFKYNVYASAERELYDLQEDPEEIHNRADDPGYAGAVGHLSALLNHWIASNADPFYELRPTARDGTPLPEMESKRETP